MVEGVREAVREEVMGAVERAEALSVAVARTEVMTAEAMEAAVAAVGSVDQLLSVVMVAALAVDPMAVVRRLALQARTVD